jgi:uncharacterized protein
MMTRLPFSGARGAMISVEQARGYYPTDDPAHDFDHVLRVAAMARRLASAEGADLEIVETAALLHDIARGDERTSGCDHALESARRASEILASWPRERSEAVAHAIAAHRFRNDLIPGTPEAKVLYDADKLDSMGAIGVARAYAVAGMCGQRLWATVEEGWVERKLAQERHRDMNAEHTPVHEFAFKLSRLEATLFTPTARAIAARRRQFMVDFFARLEMEVRGEA